MLLSSHLKLKFKVIFNEIMHSLHVVTKICSYWFLNDSWNLKNSYDSWLKKWKNVPNKRIPMTNTTVSSNFDYNNTFSYK
jgi:hypothetical protein